MDRSTAISCLAAGEWELAALLGYRKYHQPLDRSELVDRWIAKVVGAGLDESDARAFLEQRLSWHESPSAQGALRQAAVALLSLSEQLYAGPVPGEQLNPISHCTHVATALAALVNGDYRRWGRYVGLVDDAAEQTGFAYRVCERFAEAEADADDAAEGGEA